MVHAREEGVEPLLSTLEEAMRLGPVVFDDWQGVTGYDPAVRVRMTAWTRRFGAGLAATHILLASRILSMGVSLATRAANLPVTGYDERLEFERVLRTHFPPVPGGDDAERLETVARREKVRLPGTMVHRHG